MDHGFDRYTGAIEMQAAKLMVVSSCMESTMLLQDCCHCAFYCKEYQMHEVVSIVLHLYHSQYGSLLIFQHYENHASLIAHHELDIVVAKIIVNI